MFQVAIPPTVDVPKAWPAVRARPKRLPFAQTLAFASLGVPTAVAALMLNTYMPRFFAGHEGLTLASVAAVFGLSRLIDIPFDPLVASSSIARGWRSDGTGFVALQRPLILAATWGLVHAPPHVGVGYLLFWLFGRQRRLRHHGSQLLFLGSLTFTQLPGTSETLWIHAEPQRPWRSRHSDASFVHSR